MGNAVAIGIGLIVLTVIVYARVANHDFVYFDDPKYVTENPVVLQGLTSDGIRWALVTGTDANWFPITWMSHMLDVQIFGLHPGGHHLTSLALHLVNTILLFVVFHRMTRAIGRSAFVAAMFAIHPLHVESVAWVAERKDVLSTMFFMLTLVSYAWYVRAPTVRRYLVVTVLFVLGLMSKPMVVTLPFVLLLLDFWPLERATLGSDQWGVWMRLLREKLPMLALALASSIITFNVQQRGGAVTALDSLPLVTRISNALAAYSSYIEKTLWPSGLAAFYPYPDALFYAQGLLVLGGVSFLVVRARRRYPYLFVGWFWFVGMLVPVIGIVQVGNQSMADRYMYLPMIGLLVMAAWGIPELLARWPKSKVAIPIAAALALVGCGVVARRQVDYWKNSKALWTHALAVTSDNYLAHNNLGLALAGEGKTDSAIAHYRTALGIRRNYATAHTNLGVALVTRGKVDEAIAEYREALRIRPSFAETHSDLAAALVTKGSVDEAIKEYAEAVRLKPNFAEAYGNWGLALAGQGKLDDAIAKYNEALRLKPGFADVRNNLGYALATQGKLQEAVQQYRIAVTIKPDFALAHINMGMALANLDRRDEAIREFKEVLRIQPTNEAAKQALEQLTSQTR